MNEEKMSTTRKRLGIAAQRSRPEMSREPSSEKAAIEEIDRIIARLDVEIPEAQKSMDALLVRLRTTRIAA